MAVLFSSQVGWKESRKMEYDPSLVGGAGLNCRVSVTSLCVSWFLWLVDTVYSLRYIGLTPIALFAIPSHILDLTVWNQICFRNLIWDMWRFAKKFLGVECSHNAREALELVSAGWWNVCSNETSKCTHVLYFSFVRGIPALKRIILLFSRAFSSILTRVLHGRY